MTDVKLFKINDDKFDGLYPGIYPLEKELQRLFEKNLESLLGITFLITEYVIGKPHSGRIDTLGIDENSCPVIIEYKRSSHSNIINQGLFYLNWLMEHKADFNLIVLEKLGKEKADNIDWSAPRLVCIANDFDKYDSHAVNQIDRNIELFKYKKYGDDFLILELINSATEAHRGGTRKNESSKDTNEMKKNQNYSKYSTEIKKMFDELRNYTMSLGDDVQMKELKYYVAFHKIRNFVCIVFQQKKLVLTLHLNPNDYEMEERFIRDVSIVGTWGTGDISMEIKNMDDVKKAKNFIMEAYQKN